MPPDLLHATALGVMFSNVFMFLQRCIHRDISRRWNPYTFSSSLRVGESCGVFCLWKKSLEKSRTSPSSFCSLLFSLFRKNFSLTRDCRHPQQNWNKTLNDRGLTTFKTKF